jgi:signal transduction histidine kinase
MHDNIIQTLCAIGMGFEECRHLIQESPEAATNQLTRAIKELNAVIHDVRQYLVGQDMEPQSCAAYFQSELTRLIQAVETTKGRHFRNHVDARAINSLSQKIAQHVMSITREAVSNSLRHSEASTVSMSLQANGAKLCLAIEDDGVGFDPESRRSQGHGLRNIAARTQQIGGTLHVMSQPGHGTRILIEFPEEISCL